MSTKSVGNTLERVSPFDKILRGRKTVVASQLDEVRQSVPSPRILFVDDQSLSQLAQFPVYGAANGSGVTCGGTPSPLSDRFDYIDAVGALGKLSEAAASRLVCCLVGLLAPGGALLLSSFTPEAIPQGLPPDHGKRYCRTEWEMARLLTSVSNGDIVGHAIWRSEDAALVYLEVRK